MVINIHAGHAKDGASFCGAVGIINESTEARYIKDKVISYLEANGHTCYDCTIDSGSSQTDILRKIVNKCNEHKADVDVSIHFNAFDQAAHGTEVLVFSKASKSYNCALRVLNKITSIGFTNRGIKERQSLYFLKFAPHPAILIETCFCDNRTDVDLYNKKKDSIAKAIAEGIVGTTLSEPIPVTLYNKKEFKVKIIVDSLNYRSGTGTSYKVLGSIKKNEVYTIVETNGNWGKLKSGAGWINLSDKYVKRV